jgi:hypothetical protein
VYPESSIPKSRGRSIPTYEGLQYAVGPVEHSSLA